MVLWDPSPPSSRSAGFLNKVTILCPNVSVSPFIGLSCKEQVSSLDSVAVSKSIPLHSYVISSDPSQSLINKHPYFFPTPVLILDKQLMEITLQVFAFITLPHFVVQRNTIQMVLESLSPGLQS